MSDFRRVAVLGLGQIGGSLLRAVRELGLDPIGYDVDPATAEAAAIAGFAVAPDSGAAVRGADLVVLAMPLPALADAIDAIAPALRPGTVLTDVGTLKEPVLRTVRERAPHAVFVGGHPLAGVEQTGWDAGDERLFRDAPWALVLEGDTAMPAWLALAELVCHLGARPVPATAADHDAAIARVIGLPHVLAEALALTGLAGGPLGLSLAAGSYRSGSRVARTRPDLVTTWCDGNPALIDALDDAIVRLTATRSALADGGSVRELATAGHRARIDWENRHAAPVEIAPDADALRELGRVGGWLTAVLRDADGAQLLGMRPAS